MTTLMIVDDASFMRLTIKNMLDENEYKVVAEAADGLEAVEKYCKFKPDIVTMDITMPNMTGLEALKKIKEIDSKAKIVMISAVGQEAFIKEAVLSGATTFIVKPFQKEKLIEVLDGLKKLS